MPPAALVTPRRHKPSRRRIAYPDACDEWHHLSQTTGMLQQGSDGNIPFPYTRTRHLCRHRSTGYVAGIGSDLIERVAVYRFCQFRFLAETGKFRGKAAFCRHSIGRMNSIIQHGQCQKESHGQSFSRLWQQVVCMPSQDRTRQ